MLRSSPCDYSDLYLVVKETITSTAAGEDAGARQADERNKLAPFTDCVGSNLQTNTFFIVLFL